MEAGIQHIRHPKDIPSATLEVDGKQVKFEQNTTSEDTSVEREDKTAPIPKDNLIEASKKPEDASWGIIPNVDPKDVSVYKPTKEAPRLEDNGRDFFT